MRAGRVVSWSGSTIGWLRSSPRRVWWASFVLVALLSGMWAVANPLYAAPDEPSHVIRAVALDHGQLTGRTPSRRETEALGLTDRGDYLLVSVPAIYGKAEDTTCFVHRPFRTAACLRFAGPAEDADVGTYVARHPPGYYAVIGTLSWIGRPGSWTVYAMRFIGVFLTAAFIATAITALHRTAAPRLLGVGLALAITPMVLFVSSTVNPSAPEIAASLAFWICGLLLTRRPSDRASDRASDRIDNRLVNAAGLAGCVLALSRQLGPLWLGLIALTILGVSGRSTLRDLARSNRVRVWTLLVTASALVQVGWDLIVKPLDVTRSGHAPSDIPAAEVVQLTLGQTLIRYREMIGWFGWLDTPAPALAWVPWTIVLALLFFAAFVWATRRQLAVLLALLAATIVLPVIIESATYADAGTFSWQGRYTLPLAVGVPILACFVLSSTELGRTLATPRLLFAVAAVVSGAHIFAFGQNLRRYTVGYYGNIQFWTEEKWSPPMPSLLLTIAFAIAAFAFVWWVLVGHLPRDGTSRRAHPRDRSESSTERDETVALAEEPAGKGPVRGE
jgi:hypothetical protein